MQTSVAGTSVSRSWLVTAGETDPAEVQRFLTEAMQGLKESGQAVGAATVTQLADFAPPTIMSQAARLQSRQRYFNVVVTNVPGPQFPLYLLGRKLEHFYPVVPLAQRQALGIAVMSYDGKLGFGLLADYDALPDLEQIATHLDEAIADLAAAAGVAPATPRVPGSRPRAQRRAKQAAAS